MSIPAGTRFGAFEIVAPIGKGGMGEVYRARDTRLGREVAIKVLPEHLVQNEDALKRFEREAKMLAALSHPNIVTIHDVGTEQGISFVVMELLEGQTLRSRIGQSAVPWEKALKIAIPIAEGLAAAHSKGVIHRDLKPENIFLTSDGHVKILDFGLARFKPPLSQEVLTEVPTQSRATESGLVLGTVPYMSPEQVRGESVDARTDIFSFGCVLYEMITAQRAFMGHMHAEIAAAILRDEPAKLKEVPPELDHLVTHCLEKNPEQRFQSVRDLAFQLHEIESGLFSSRSVAVASTRPVFKKYFTGIAVVILALIALLISLNVGGLRERFIAKQKQQKIDSLAVLPLKNLSGDRDQEYFADGMTEELIAKLARIESMRVISRTSVMEYKTQHKSLKQIAKELNVNGIVEGSVMKAGNRVRITAQLIEASTDRHLWAESYERDLQDILSLQNDVASAIATEIKGKLTIKDKAHFENAPRVRPDAYEAYLRGRSSLNVLMGGQDAPLAVKMLQRAVDLDPTFAQAYADLSQAHLWMYYIGLDRTKERLEMAKKAADRVFQLEPDSPAGHRALGWYYYRCFDYERALQEFRKVERSEPGDSEIILGIAAVRRRQGHFDESFDLMKKAMVLAPRMPEIPMELSITLTYLRKYSKAQQYCDLSISLKPDQTNSYILKARNYWLQGSLQQGRKVLEEIADQNHPEVVYCKVTQELYSRNYEAALAVIPSAISEGLSGFNIYIPWGELRGFVYYLKGELKTAYSSFESSRVLLEKEVGLRPDDHRVHSALGFAYAGLGRKEDAIREGQLAVELNPVSRDPFGWAPVENLARIYVMVGMPDAAIDQLDYLLSIPSPFSVDLLRIDPIWDPLRNLPRFQKMLEKHSNKN